MNVAVWRRDGRWHCLSSSDASFAMDHVQAMAVLTEDGDTTLFLAGVPGRSMASHSAHPVCVGRGVA